MRGEQNMEGRMNESEVQKGEREVCIRVVGNRGIFSSSHTQRVGRNGGDAEQDRKRQPEIKI